MTGSRTLLALAFISILLAAPAAQQTARISGVVTSADAAAQPVRRAIVSLTSTEILNNVSAITDDRGRFDITGVPAGRVTITVSKPAHLTIPYGATRPGRPGTPISISPGEHQRDLIVRLPRASVITGTIRNSHGEPLANLPVMVQRAELLTGLGGYVSESEALQTDDRGAYRAFGLLPGDYIVTALPERGRSGVRRQSTADVDATLRRIQQRASAGRGAANPVPATVGTTPDARAYDYAPVFYPGTAVASDAAVVRVALGEERSGVDFSVDLAPSVTVSGRLTMPDGAGLPDVSLLLAVTGPPLPIFEDARTTVRAGSDGVFRFSNVSPGRYILTAIGGLLPQALPNQPRWSQVTLDVTVDDVAGLLLTLKPAATLSGRLQFDGQGPIPPPDPSTLRIALRDTTGARTRAMPYIDGIPADGTAPIPTAARADGTFEIQGILPGRFTVTTTLPRAPGPGGWWLKSAVVGGRDVLDDPLEVTAQTPPMTGAVVTFSDRHAELTGSLQTASGQPATEFFVIVFPTERAWWRPGARRVRATRPASDGRYSVIDLPAGDYFIAALTDVEPDEWRNPAFLAQLVGASIRITVRDGARTTQDIRLK
jgi:hypothetical protein